MTYMIGKTRNQESATTWQRLNDLRLDLEERIAKYWLYRSTLTDLTMLSDRELSDIGVPRGMIDDAASRATYDA
jgi:uncharacterized protein YjiS (DUF1127 family)